MSMKNKDENIYMNSLYSTLAKRRGKLDGLIFVEPITKKPNVDEINYGDKFIVRYFVKKSNSEQNTIYEIDSVQFNTLQKNSFYTCIPVLWQVSGGIETKNTDQGKIVGAREFNLNSVKKANNKIKGIGKVLNNPLEFYKDI